MRSESKQSYEIAKEVAKGIEDAIKTDAHNVDIERWVTNRVANILYDAGYRKQSENTVEVVRCKDCKYARGNLVSIGIIDCLMYRDMRKGEDFCNYGERKGGAE